MEMDLQLAKQQVKLTAPHDELLNEAEVAAVAEQKEIHSFEIDPSQVENVKQRCLQNALNYPMLDEYDFRNDTVNLDLDMELNPQAQPRPYQTKSLTKMFGNALGIKRPRTDQEQAKKIHRKKKI